MSHVEENLPELALGTLDEPSRAGVLAHLSTCQQCSDRYAQLSRAVDAMASTVEAQVAPFTSWQALEPKIFGKRRFWPFVSRVGELFDLTTEATQNLLETLDDESAWQEGMAEGIRVIPVEAGKGTGDAITTLVRISPGATLPHHDHAGNERMFVLQGGFRETGGNETWRGEELLSAVNTGHGVVALEGPDCIAAVVLEFDTAES